MSLPSPKEALLYLLLCALLAARHLSLYYGHTEFAHFGQIARSLALMEQGQLWFAGSELVQTGLRLGGPIYYWLHLPALLFHNPVVGLHLYYSLLELAAITLFLIWGPRLVPRHRNSDRSSPALASAGGVARPLRATGMRHPRSYPANASSQRSTHRNSCDGATSSSI